MSELTVFYAWQNDTPNKFNRYLIRDALSEAIRRLERDPDVLAAPRIDHDTKGIAGCPDIATEIFSKIDACSLFVADITLVPDGIDDQERRKRMPNSNVMIEFGYALKSLGPQRVITVLNSHFGPPEDVPFDLRNRRHIVFNLDPDSPDRKADERRNLSQTFEYAVKAILATADSAANYTRQLRVRVSPTRNGRRQLAQFQVFNPGPGPVYLNAWSVRSDGAMSDSIICVDGKFPYRLQEQDSYSILVDISEFRVDEITGLAIVDGEYRLHSADEWEVKRFVHVAVAHRPLDVDTAEKPDEALRSCNVDIQARLADSSRDGEKRLEFVFANQGDVPINTHGGELKWEFETPRERPGPPDSPKVAQAGGSMSLATDSPDEPVPPGGQKVFFVHPKLVGGLIVLLADDIPDENISVTIHSDTALAWTATEDEVPDTVRAAAQFVAQKQGEVG